MSLQDNEENLCKRYMPIIFQRQYRFAAALVVVFFLGIVGGFFIQEAKSLIGPSSGPGAANTASLAKGSFASLLGTPTDTAADTSLFGIMAKLENKVDAVSGGGSASFLSRLTFSTAQGGKLGGWKGADQKCSLEYGAGWYACRTNQDIIAQGHGGNTSYSGWAGDGCFGDSKAWCSTAELGSTSYTTGNFAFQSSCASTYPVLCCGYSAAPANSNESCGAHLDLPLVKDGATPIAPVAIGPDLFGYYFTPPQQANKTVSYQELDSVTGVPIGAPADTAVAGVTYNRIIWNGNNFVGLLLDSTNGLCATAFDKDGTTVSGPNCTNAFNFDPATFQASYIDLLTVANNGYIGAFIRTTRRSSTPGEQGYSETRHYWYAVILNTDGNYVASQYMMAEYGLDCSYGCDGSDRDPGLYGIVAYNGGFIAHANMDEERQDWTGGYNSWDFSYAYDITYGGAVTDLLNPVLSSFGVVTVSHPDCYTPDQCKNRGGNNITATASPYSKKVYMSVSGNKAVYFDMSDIIGTKVVYPYYFTGFQTDFYNYKSEYSNENSIADMRGYTLASGEIGVLAKSRTNGSVYAYIIDPSQSTGFKTGYPKEVEQSVGVGWEASLNLLAGDDAWLLFNDGVTDRVVIDKVSF